jgi:hypothetical protein
MPQAQVSNIEGGEAVPTLPLPARPTEVLDMSPRIELDGDSSSFAIWVFGSSCGLCAEGAGGWLG